MLGYDTNICLNLRLGVSHCLTLALLAKIIEKNSLDTFRQHGTGDVVDVSDITAKQTSYFLLCFSVRMTETVTHQVSYESFRLAARSGN